MDCPKHDNRRSPRSRVFLAAVLEWPERSITVVLRDLSEHGALVETTESIEAHSIVLFRRNGVSVRGHIAWVRGNKVGVAFARPLKATEVLRYIVRPDDRATDQPVFRRPALTQKGMSAEEQRWADEMMKEPSRRNRR